MTEHSRQQGLAGEDEACRYLQQQGLKLRERNYHCKCGELDLVMNHQNTIVFVEVRYRKNSRFGGPLASITREKQRKLLLAANYYLLDKKLNHYPCRFDVIAIQPAAKGYAIQWLQNAIEE